MIYDIGIIGAGPAGATFARVLAKQKPELKILLLDGQEITNKKPCGGLLSPDAQKVLARCNLTLPKSILVDPQIFSVKTIDFEQELENDYSRFYLNMDRFAFDQWMISLIPEHVKYQKGKCIKIEKVNDRFALTISNKSKRQVVEAKQIVGAEGANSIVRRTFFKHKIKHHIAIQEWFLNKEKLAPKYFCVFDRPTSDNCSWLMHKDEYVIYGGAFPPKKCRLNYENQITRFEIIHNHALGEPVKIEACKVLSPRRWKDFVLGNKEGVYLIGEAAGLISASSLEGFSYAFESGIALADAFVSNISSDDVTLVDATSSSASFSTKNIFKSYKKKIRKTRLKLLTKIIKMYFLHTPWTRELIMKSGIDSIKKKTLER